MSESTVATTGQDATQQATIEESIEQGKRAFALKKFEQAVDHYATALELMTAKYGDDALELADLYFVYGKAVLENAIAQSAVLGKEQADDAMAGDDAPQKGSTEAEAFLSFSGDADDDDTMVTDGDDAAVDLFAEANNMVEEEEHQQDEGTMEDDEAEPEDDFNAAWEVLDLARALYEKQKDEDDEIKLKLADTYIALGDVSLETEKFDQAITDYTAGTMLKNELLPISSRQIAEAHYKLSMVLDLTSGRLSDAIEHAEKALISVEARLAELRSGLSGQLKAEPEVEQPKKDIKGKGKAVATTRLVRDESVHNMTKPQIEGEIKDLDELREDLALKVEELKTTPIVMEETAPALAARALDRDLNAAPAGAIGGSSTVVNDLTSMVVKKKKKPVGVETEMNGSVKRKAEAEALSGGPEKKVKLDEMQP